MKPLNGFNLTPCRLMRRGQTGAYRRAIKQNRASTTIACIAPDLDVSLPKAFTQQV
jgi:hypothetical protein